MSRLRWAANINEMSTVFDDYTSEARQKYAGYTRISLHVPKDVADELHLGKRIVLDFDTERDA